MFFLLTILLAGALLSGGYVFYNNPDLINTKAYTSYTFSETNSEITLGTLPIANTEGGPIPTFSWTTCPQGYQWDGTQCVSTPTACPPPGTWNPSTGRCEAQGTMSTGYYCEIRNPSGKLKPAQNWNWSSYGTSPVDYALTGSYSSPSPWSPISFSVSGNNHYNSDVVQLYFPAEVNYTTPDFKIFSNGDELWYYDTGRRLVSIELVSGSVFVETRTDIDWEYAVYSVKQKRFIGHYYANTPFSPLYSGEFWFVSWERLNCSASSMQLDTFLAQISFNITTYSYSYLSCPSGYTSSGNICIANPQCPSGGYYDARQGKCISYSSGALKRVRIDIR